MIPRYYYGRILFNEFIKLKIKSAHRYTTWEALPARDKEAWSDLGLNFLAEVEWIEQWPVSGQTTDATSKTSDSEP